MRSRSKRYRSTTKIGIVSLILVLLFGLASGVYMNVFSSAAPLNLPIITDNSWSELLPKWRDVLVSGIPGFVDSTQKQPTVKVTKKFTTQYVLRGVVFFFAGIDIKDLRSFFNREIPLLASVKQSAPVVKAANPPNITTFDSRNTILSGKPLVGIYHTHTSESFIPSSGVAHKPGGQRGDIVEVGASLAKRLEEKGIKSVFSKNIHDYPSFMKAYGSSEVTVKQMLLDNPSIQMLFDIHRDADKRENVTAIVNGIEVAKITFLVATGQPDLVQPRWQENHAFAKLIDAKLNQRFPGVSRGIVLVDWRYNQQLHPRALLLEIGSQESKKEEAIRSVEMLGDVLAEIVAD